MIMPCPARSIALRTDSTKNGGDGSVSLSNPEVKKAAVAAFSPQLVQKSVDTIIDSNYGWLQGKQDTNFNIDLSAAKQDFAKRVGNT